MTDRLRSIPTKYREILFRSRLEARFAALFDVLGWTWEYEPEFEGAYIPDFVLHGLAGMRVVVEVKSPDDYYENRLAIIRKAVDTIGYFTKLLILTGEFAEDGMWPDTVVFGFMPYLEQDYPSENMFWEDEHARLFRPGVKYGLEYDFAETWGSWAGNLSGAYDGNALYEGTMLSKAELLQLWSRAGNIIQWKPR